ncbi:hypothetical protein GF412_04635 [Candidatus Micrarchaeota archaeon]|nr:hypothetical protein [Candidatus Micrarchaeota archaeon]MBD3418239.1 hypothetical protein [Candidatus Micrarchaeota archaeon]
MVARALHKGEISPKANPADTRRRPFIKRMLSDPPQFKPILQILTKIKENPSRVTPAQVRELKKLFLEVHPSDRDVLLDLQVFASFSRLIVSARGKYTRATAQWARDSIPWNFRE